MLARWLAVLAIGCNGGSHSVAADGAVAVVDSCTIVSGSRLRANYWVTPDGGRYFAGSWHDKMLDHDCAFGSFPGDDNVYCLPTSDGIWASEYSDDLCTVPVVDVDPGCSVASPIFGFSLVSSAGPSLAFYPIAGAYTGMRWQANGCQSATDPAPAGYEYHSVDAPLDKTMFAAVAPYTGTGTARLRATGYMAPDGAIQACSATTFFDSQRNEVCHPEADSTGQTRCLPEGYSVSGGTVFSDPACKDAAVELSAKPQLSYEAASVALACGSGTQLFSLSGPLTSEYTNVTGSCAAVSPTMPYYYTAGAEVTPSRFVALTDATLPLAGQRLQEIARASADGFGMASGTFSDSQLGGATCQFSTASDGTVRCLPGDPGNVPTVGVFYSDELCTTPISIITTACADTPPQFAQLLEAPSMHASCSYRSVARVFAVGAMVTGMLFQIQGTSCVIGTYAGYAFALGDELAPSTFVQATLAAE